MEPISIGPLPKPTRWNRSRGVLCLGLILLAGLVLAGCKKDPRLEFIQGLWYSKNAHLANIPGERAQETNWEFDNGYFSSNTCCFAEAYYSGYYTVMEREENKLTLELHNMRGQVGDIILDKADVMSAVIKLDTEHDTIRINGDGPYTRVSP